MNSQRVAIAFALLIAGVGVSTAVLFARGFGPLGVLGAAILAGLIGLGARAARSGRPGDAAMPFGAPRPAKVPPDGHIRFTLVVEGLEPGRIAEVWSDLRRPDSPAPEDLRLLFRNFTVVEGRRFRFLRGDPTATAALLTAVLGTAAGIPVRTHLEPAAERTPPWS
jgi:hypothetical protein